MKSLGILIGRAVYWCGWPVLWLVARFGRPRTRVFVVAGGEFLVLKGWIGSGDWILPGGGIHRAEVPVEAGQREVLEEVGIKLDKQSIRQIGNEHLVSKRHGLPFRQYFFVAQLRSKPSLILQKNEIYQAHWMNIKNCPDANLRFVIDSLGGVHNLIK